MIELVLAIDDGEGSVRQFTFPLTIPAFEDVTEGTGWTPSFILSRGASFGDIDYDGDGDFAIGEFLARMRFFSNEADGTFSLSRLVSTQGRLPIFFDIDGDGVRDMLAVGNNRSYVALGDGAGHFEIQLTAGEHPLAIEGLQTITPIDLEGDLDLDIVVTARSVVAGHAMFVLENDGAGNFTDVWETSGVSRLAFSSYTLAVDYDGDGDTDLIQLHQGPTRPPVRLYQNDGAGFFRDVSVGNIPNATCPGFASCQPGRTLAAGDYDNDGDTRRSARGSKQVRLRRSLVSSHSVGFTV